MVQQVNVLNTKLDSLTSVHGRRKSVLESCAMTLEYRIVLGDKRHPSYRALLGCSQNTITAEPIVYLLSLIEEEDAEGHGTLT